MNKYKTRWKICSKENKQDENNNKKKNLKPQRNKTPNQNKIQTK